MPVHLINKIIETDEGEETFGVFVGVNLPVKPIKTEKELEEFIIKSQKEIFNFLKKYYEF